MIHLGTEALRRILAGEGGSREVENAAEHIVSCEQCRSLADQLRAELPDLTAEGPLRLAFELIDREHQWALEPLNALAEWSALQRMSNRRSQRDRVRMSKACHTLAFVDLVVAQLKEATTWDQAEFLASLALLSIEAVSQHELSEPAKNDLKADVWTAVANARRRAAEWKRAHQALGNADRFLRQGTGDLYRGAGLLSISASTLADEGQVAQARKALDRCAVIYRDLSEWTLLARTLVKLANILAGTDPARGLITLDQASPFIPAKDTALRLFAEMVRVECLIEVGKSRAALRVFQRWLPVLSATKEIRPRIRGLFTGARLLDALGSKKRAEPLFEEVVKSDIEHELYKDAFLDLLYLYGAHTKAGDLDKAAAVCRKALTDPVLAAVAHDQLRTLWTQLLEATQRQAVSQEMLRELRLYLSIHWKHPAANPPVVAVQ